ncbi:DUF550 domain-containing protein [Klebsiella pneumoniae]|nr:DUF550 domain-containing protein [Klebsiella pneumoniae]HDH0494532.1 DUF550 domain-containing protein [Klebsiella pneumoniae]HDH1250200.1 DUF550 domain-containing protein [Klebsiella pneumoniae]
MTKSTITIERIQRIIRAIDSEAYDEEEIREWLSSDEIMELSRMALAAMNGEPVAYTDERNLGYIDRGRETAYLWGKQNSEASDVELYRHAQPAPERDQVRREHAEWSQATFGDVGPVGPLKHLSKEALEAAAEPGDLSEWADIQFLLWDAQRRAGISDEQITQAMIEKLAVNKQREWPEPKDGEPRLHIKAQPALVVPDEIKHRIGGLDWGWEGEFNRGWNACRAAMLQAEPVCTCPSGDGSLRWPCPVHPGNSPVIPDGYVMVPKEPTKEMINAGWLYYMGTKNPSSKGTYKAMLAAAQQEGK